MSTGINALNEAVKEAGSFTHPLFNELGKVIVGQHYLTERLVIGLLANGHVLLEGVPGLAKTLAVKTLSQCLSVKFSRLQFTPDMLPADVIGTQIYNPQSGGFTTRKNAEFCVIGKRGPSVRRDAGVHEVIISPRREHSRKPDEFFQRIERYAAGPYVELFSREHRPGWTCWGNEAGKFNP